MKGRTRRDAEQAKRPFTVITLSILVAIFSVYLISHAFISKASEQYEVEKYYKSYEVQSGDNLWSIASNYYNVECGTTTEYVNEIKSMNHLEDDTIHSGEHIVIPYYVLQ